MNAGNNSPSFKGREHSFYIMPAVMSGDGPISEAIKRIAENPCFNAVEITWIKDKKV